MKRRLLTRPAIVLFGLLTVSSATLTAWFGYEELLLEDNRRPITWYTRNVVNRHTKIAYAIGCAFAMVTGIAICHFILDSEQQPVTGQ